MLPEKSRITAKAGERGKGRYAEDALPRDCTYCETIASTANVIESPILESGGQRWARSASEETGDSRKLLRSVNFHWASFAFSVPYQISSGLGERNYNRVFEHLGDTQNPYNFPYGSPTLVSVNQKS